MSWFAAVPSALVAGSWCLLPGLLVTRVAGWRGIASWGSAPVVSVALVAATAILAGRVDVIWSPWTVVITTLVVAAGVAATRAAIRAMRRKSASAVQGQALTFTPKARLLQPKLDGPFAGIALIAGMTVTIAIGWLTLVIALGAPDAISPTYDAVHHYSAVAHILTTGDASSLTVGEVTTPGTPSAYPAAWHDLVALVVLTVGASIPLASNMLALAVVVVVWPLSCVLLVRQTVGPRPGAFLVTTVVSTAFTAMPWMLMTFGVLWPNLLGLALVPAGLAAVVTVLGLARESSLGRVQAFLLGAVTVPTLGLAHPNAAVSLLVLTVAPLVYSSAVAAHRQLRARHPLFSVATLLGASLAVLATLWVLAWSPFLAGVRAFDWPVTMGAREAVLGVLWNGMNGRAEMVLISVLVIAGSIFAIRKARTGWLVPAHAISGLLYVLAASREGPITTALTGAWYNDSYRLAAMIPITGVPLATLGVIGLAGLLIRVATGWRGVALTSDRQRLIMTPVVAVVTGGLLLASGGFRVGAHGFIVGQTYQREITAMLQPGQREFLETAGTIVPPNAVVAANPWTGNALLYALTQREVLFPHMAGRWTPAQRIVQTRLREAESDPAVCAAVRTTGVNYVIDGPVSFWPGDKRAQSFPGLSGIAEAPGFEPMISGGGSTLYRITACGIDPPRTSG